MKIDTKAVPLPEAAYYLRSHLGPLRNWVNFLTDNIRGKQSIAGHTLTPCIRMQDDRTFRPMYEVQDLKDFVSKVLADVPGAGPAPIKAVTLAVDRTRHWRVNKFDRHGAPVARMRELK